MEFNFGHVKFEMSFQHVTGDIDLGVSHERVVSLIKESKKRVLVKHRGQKESE